MKLITVLGLAIPYFLITTIILNLIWYIFIYGKLYYCSDPLIFPLMFPPFVHEVSPTDHYIAPKLLVDTLGTVFLLASFLIPLLLSSITIKKSRVKF